MILALLEVTSNGPTHPSIGGGVEEEEQDSATIAACNLPLSWAWVVGFQQQLPLTLDMVRDTPWFLYDWSEGVIGSGSDSEAHLGLLPWAPESLRLPRWEIGKKSYSLAQIPYQKLCICFS